jgi:hypothetical protein
VRCGTERLHVPPSRAHGALMAVQAATELHHHWSKFLTDIPFVSILALRVYLWRRKEPVGQINSR